MAGPDDEFFDDDEFDDDELFDGMECGLGPDGQCGLAGTEWCDFKCPYRDSEDFAGSEAWRRKHDRAASRADAKYQQDKEWA